MQKYHSIADVTLELRKVVEKKTKSVEGTKKIDEEVVESVGNGGDDASTEWTVEDIYIYISGSH